MEWIVALALVALIVYLVLDDKVGEPMVPLARRKRLCDYTASGGVYEDLSTVLARGSRLYEVHVYSDEQDHPVVARRPLNDGYDYAEDNVTFEQVCVDLVNDAFPSKDPFILSIVMHTHKAVTANECAMHIKQTLRRRLLTTNASVARMPIDDLADKVIIVSGGTIRGTELEPLVNLSWMTEDLRRLSYQQALHPRDEAGLMAYAQSNIVLVAPETEVRTVNANPDRPKALGCQWNLYDTSGGGFVEKPDRLKRKFLAE
jgi:hypothetical protein